MNRHFYLLLFIFLLSNYCKAQDFYKYLTLDSITVAATKKGFDVNDFIELIKSDTTFAYAFMNLRICAHSSESEVQYFNKHDFQVASAAINTQQFFEKDCRWMDITKNESKGKFYKNNLEYRYFTSELFDRTFYTKGKVCNFKPNLTSKAKLMN